MYNTWYMVMEQYTFFYTFRDNDVWIGLEYKEEQVDYFQWTDGTKLSVGDAEVTGNLNNNNRKTRHMPKMWHVGLDWIQ